jgi:cytochrome P450
MAKFQESDKISLPKEKNLLTLPPQCLTDDDCFPFPDDFDIDGMRIIKPNSMFQSIGNIPEG